MAPNTPMQAASIVKGLVAATVLALENEKRLSCDDLVVEHWGHRPWFGVLPNTETIMIAHLFRHQSGLPEFQIALAARIAMEAFPGTHHWARELSAHGHSVRLIAPHYIRPFLKRQ